mgnify:FL=1
MGKKIMVLSGSPRKNGNTNTVVDWFIKGAADEGADVELVDVAALHTKFNGCIACKGCQKSDEFECVVKDEATPILARIPEMDVLVFATPVFFFGPSAQLKLFIDRMYSLCKFNYTTGEIRHNLGHLRLGLITTGGGDLNSGLNLVEQTFQHLAVQTNHKLESMLVPFAPTNPEDMKLNAELRQRGRLPKPHWGPCSCPLNSLICCGRYYCFQAWSMFGSSLGIPWLLRLTSTTTPSLTALSLLSDGL